MLLITKLRNLECGTCGVWHAIPESMYKTCLEEGGFWHCPNGHGRGYGEGTIKADLKREKEKLAKEIKRRE